MLRLKRHSARCLSLALLTFMVCSGALTAPAASPPTASTHSLFTFHRDDVSPGQVTRIQINAARAGATPVQQAVFGNFIEHLTDVIYHTLWADALGNPNLERLEPGNPMPPYWDAAGATQWPDAGGYVSPRFVRLSAPDGTLSQRLFLPVQRTRTYTLTFYARGPGQLRVSLRAGDGLGGAIVRQAVVTPREGSEWRKQTLHWTLAAGALGKGQPARLVFAHMGGPDVDIDQVELFPDDAVHGMDPDALKAAKAWNIPVLRQAGNFESGYHWRDGVGPRLARPTSRNPAWPGIETNHFGTDEFLGLCQILGATPQLGVNAGNGTPEEAAAWVAYCRNKKPRIGLWEIGNELYGGWQIGHTDAPGNAARFVAFRKAMLAVDPTLRLMATGNADDPAWNEAVLRAAVADGGPAPDFLTIHPLVGLNGPGGGGYDALYESVMAHPAYLDATLLPGLIRQIQAVEGPRARTRIAPTEWGIIVGGPRWREGPNHDAEAGAVFNALTLNAFLRHGDWVTLANMTALLHGGGIKKDHGVVYVNPQYYTQKLYADAAPRFPVATAWSGPGRDVPAFPGVPAVANVPDVDVFCALSADRARLTAFVVNRRLSDARRVQIALDGFAPGSVRATILTAADPQAGNGWDHPNAVAPRPFPLPPLRPKQPLAVSLPPHSLIVFTFERGPGVRASPSR